MNETTGELTPEVTPAGVLTGARVPGGSKRRRLRVKPKHGHILALERAVLQVALDYEKMIRQQLPRLLREGGYTEDALLPGVQLVFDLLSNQLATLVSNPSIDEFLGKLSDKVRKSNERGQARMFKISLNRVGLDASLESVRSQFIRNNIALIKSLSGGQLDSLRDLFETERLGVNATTKSMTAKIEDMFEQKKWQAKRIATDQIRTLNSQITRTMHERAGITHYIWTTAKNNTRDEHAELDGQKIAYATGAPSLDGANVGEPINCQCFAMPII